MPNEREAIVRKRVAYEQEPGHPDVTRKNHIFINLKIKDE